MIEKPNLVRDKSYAFAISIVHFHRLLLSKREYVIAKQILKSGTSIGANIREALQAESRKDFISKLSISLKEAHETVFWLELVRDTNIIEKNNSLGLLVKANEVIRILTSIIKSTKGTMK